MAQRQKTKRSRKGPAKRVNPKGYRDFRDPVTGRWVSVHRRAAKNKLGRELNPNEVVHHVNGDKLDNRYANLEVMTRSEHTRLHNKQRAKKKK